MAKLKSKVGNTTYSWSSDDIRDAEIKAITEVYGSKNLLPSINHSTNTHGFTYTLNGDGSIKVNGTSDGGWGSASSLSFTLRKGTYILSSDSYSHWLLYVDLIKESDGSQIASTDSYGHKQFTINSDTLCHANYIARAGNSVDGTLYPMIRDYRISDSTYVPYAPSNMDLAKVKFGIINGIDLNNLTWTFIGYGYGTPNTAGSAYGFIINIAEYIDGYLQINQQWCQNDQNVWHTRHSGNGGASWSAWT